MRTATIAYIFSRENPAEEESKLLWYDTRTDEDRLFDENDSQAELITIELIPNRLVEAITLEYSYDFGSTWHQDRTIPFNGTNSSNINIVEEFNTNIISQDAQQSEIIWLKALISYNSEMQNPEHTNKLKLTKQNNQYCEIVTLYNTNPMIEGEFCRGIIGVPCTSSCKSGDCERVIYQEPMEVSWVDCETGQRRSQLLEEGESITVNRQYFP